MGSVYDQIGGPAAVTAAVEDLYARIGDDPQLAPYFDGIEMGGQKRHMRAFLAMALGGERVYQGRDMRTAHAHLDITDDDFDRITEHLSGALRGLGVGPEQTSGILARVALLRPEVTAC